MSDGFSYGGPKVDNLGIGSVQQIAKCLGPATQRLVVGLA